MEGAGFFGLWQGGLFWPPAGGGAGFILDAEKYKPRAPPGHTL